jgi:uncharacterized protein (UPF0297 family)
MAEKKLERETIPFSVDICKKEKDIYDVVCLVFQALVNKGYTPINQIVAYLRSGDPTYITTFNNARSEISKLDRDEIMRAMLRDYLRNCREHK